MRVFTKKERLTEPARRGDVGETEGQGRGRDKSSPPRPVESGEDAQAGDGHRGEQEDGKTADQRGGQCDPHRRDFAEEAEEDEEDAADVAGDARSILTEAQNRYILAEGRRRRYRGEAGDAGKEGVRSQAALDVRGVSRALYWVAASCARRRDIADSL